MRVLGIDPGIGRMGWGIVDSEGSKLQAVDYGCLETEANSAVPKRLQFIHSFVLKTMKTYKPDVMAIEDLFFSNNAKTAFVVGQARGVILLAAAEYNIPVKIYTPLQVKIAVTGYGRAEKAQVGKMVQTILKLKTIPKPDDTTDALAIALTGTFSRKED